MRPVQFALVLAVSGVGVALQAGCEDEHHEHHDRDHVVLNRPGEVVTVQPGYYYEREYYDTRGDYHPRAYYHYDGNRWESIREVPRGYDVRERPMNAREHEEHEEHEHR